MKKIEDILNNKKSPYGGESKSFLEKLKLKSYLQASLNNLKRRNIEILNILLRLIFNLDMKFIL